MIDEQFTADTRRRKKKVAFPMFGHYNIPIAYFVEHALHADYVRQPPLTRRTMEIGAKYSPDMVCTPFKTVLGSSIEALEAGADTLILPMGLCRLGYYGELAEQILRDLGYHFEMINMAEYTTDRPLDYLKAFRGFRDRVRPVRFGQLSLNTLKMAEHLDEMEGEYYKNVGFETQKGAYEKAFKTMLAEMKNAGDLAAIDAAYARCKSAFSEIPVEKGEFPLRVGIIGEYFTVMDAFSNCDLEKMLADMGVEVHRWMNVTHRNIHYPGEKNLHVRISDLCSYEMGPTSTANIWCARDYAERGFDGLIHVKSAGCTPEIDIMPVLREISEQYDIPVLYLTYDTETGTAGLLTRLEAFYDMIRMRKKVV